MAKSNVYPFMCEQSNFRTTNDHILVPKSLWLGPFRAICRVDSSFSRLAS